MKTKIQKWGNSLAVRLPKHITEQKGLQDGAGVIVVLKNDQIVIEPLEEIVTLESLLLKITDENLHQETDWFDPKGNEIW